MNKLTQKVAKGFTLIELMIVVAIIGILAAIAIPKFADLVTKSKEASIKGSLGSVRSAISIYYSDNEGVYPIADQVENSLTTAAKYLQEIPTLAVPNNGNGNPGHTGNRVVLTATAVNDGAASASIYWYTTATGDIRVNCTHRDTKSSTWSTW